MSHRFERFARLRARVSSRGFTLTEILVSMTVLSLVMVASLTVFLPSLGRFAQADTAYDAQRHALAALTALAADLRDTRAKRLADENATPGAKAFYIPTARDASGTFVLTPEDDVLDADQPDWQGWVVYYTTADPAEGATGLFRLHRRYLPYDPSLDKTDELDGGRLVASGLLEVTVQVGTDKSANLMLIGNRPFRLCIDRGATSAWTVGGRGLVRIDIETKRVLHDQATCAKGEKTIDVSY